MEVGITVGERYFVVRSGATALRNETVHDGSISIQALGLLTVMLSMPPGAPLGYRAFMGRGMGQQALLRSIRELEAAGYRWRFTKRDDAGRITTVVGVFDSPHSQLEAEKALADIQNGKLSCQSTKEEVCGGNGEEDSPLREKATHGDDSPLREKATHGDDSPLREKATHGDDSPLREKPMRRADLHKQSPLREKPMHRSTVLRSGNAQLSLRDNSKKDNKLSFLPSTPVKSDGGDGGGEIEAVDLDGRSGGFSDPVLSAEVLEQIALSLPDAMCALTVSGMRRVWAVLEPKLSAGWTAVEIRRQLGMRSLPDPVHDMASLVCHRISELVDVPVRAADVSQRRLERLEAERELAAEVSEAELAEQVRLQEVFDSIRREHPDWTTPQVARHVVEVERERRREVS